MDFVTLKGIQNRTSVELEHQYLFVIKQLVNNAIDYFERQRNLPDYFVPKVSISIIGEWSNENNDEANNSSNKSQDGLLRIRVSNNVPPVITIITCESTSQEKISLLKTGRSTNIHVWRIFQRAKETSLE